MKVREIINMMSNNTEVLIYSVTEGCAMPAWAACQGEHPELYDCRDCTDYIKEESEWTKYHGTAQNCPIKLAELTVIEINNAYHNIKSTRKRKPEQAHVIAIRVS